MSLETAIHENTAALKELIAKISGAAVKLASPTESKPTTVKTEEAKPATTAKPETKTVKHHVEEKPATTTAAAVSYDDVKAAILELSETRGRETTVALLSRHGVTKAPNLKPEQYADVLTDVKAVLTGELNIEESLA